MPNGMRMTKNIKFSREESFRHSGEEKHHAHAIEEINLGNGGDHEGEEGGVSFNQVEMEDLNGWDECSGAINNSPEDSVLDEAGEGQKYENGGKDSSTKKVELLEASVEVEGVENHEEIGANKNHGNSKKIKFGHFVPTTSIMGCPDSVEEGGKGLATERGE